MSAILFSSLASTLQNIQMSNSIALANANIDRQNQSIADNYLMGTEAIKRNMHAAEDDALRANLARQQARRKTEGQVNVASAATGRKGGSAAQRMNRDIALANSAHAGQTERTVQTAQTNADMAYESLVRNSMNQMQQHINQPSRMAKFLNIGVGIGRGALAANLI